MYVGEYKYMEEKYGKENIERWIKDVKMEDLFKCMSAFSNASFVEYKYHHRDKHLNILEYILQENPSYLWRSVTYGDCPGDVCTCGIGYLTGRKYGNVEIAEFLIRERIVDLKKWLLDNYDFTDDEKRLLHYFKNKW